MTSGPGGAINAAATIPLLLKYSNMCTSLPAPTDKNHCKQREVETACAPTIGWRGPPRRKLTASSPEPTQVPHTGRMSLEDARRLLPAVIADAASVGMTLDVQLELDKCANLQVLVRY